VIYADDLVKLFGVDAVRYLMLHEMPFAQDGTLTYDIMVERINSDLANILGNLVNRTLAMTNKYNGGVVTNPKVSGEFDQELIDLALSTPKKVSEHMDRLRVQDSIDDIFDLLKRCNKYIDETSPWALAKDEANKDRLNTVLYNLLESIRISAVLLEAYIPDTSKAILDQLNTQKRDFDSITEFGQLEEGTKITDKPTILFARLDANEVMEKLQPAPKKLDTKPEVTIDDFSKLDLRVGKILSCENHPDSDKLLVSQVQIDGTVRQIVSGLRPKFEATDLVGLNVAVVVNLKPVKLRGVLSEGMILVGEKDSKMELVHFHSVEDGAIIR
jgi:methionyl-tRNA synthetase